MASFYTKKGDQGTTKVFSCDQRISKSSAIAEALGSLDETNSFLGWCKIKSREADLVVAENSLEKVISNVQQNLFIVQAEIAGVEKSLTAEKVTELEKIIDVIEKELPPINSFFVAGGSELAAMLDVARAIARRAERRVVEAKSGFAGSPDASEEAFRVKVGDHTLAYLNRLSSLLYALARLTNHKFGITEERPSY